MRISDWSSDVCSSDLLIRHEFVEPRAFGAELTETLGLPAGDERDGFIDYFDSFYTFNNYSPRRPFEADVRPILERIPIALTPFATWAKGQDWSAQSIEIQGGGKLVRSEEHTSELQSIMRRSYAGFCLKKKKKKKMIQTRPRQKKKHNRTMKSQKSTRVKNMKPTTENNELILHYINSITEVNR